MSEIICVTNRLLCKTDFLRRIEEIAMCAPRAVILREKDLSDTQYALLAKDVMSVCEQWGVPCILHSFVDAALTLHAEKIHLPMHVLRALSEAERVRFSVLGASCHSVKEAVEAQELGCTYITAGHIFATDCKKGLPPRGTDFLREVCAHVSVPVYAIGGITGEHMDEVRQCGAKGACVMSGLMRCENVRDYMAHLSGNSFD